MNRKAKEHANNLVDTFRIVLMDEDTDCGNECLCTLISVKMARITLDESIKELELSGWVKQSNYNEQRIDFLKECKKELEKI